MLLTFLFIHPDYYGRWIDLPPSQYKKVKYQVLLILPILHDKLVDLHIISVINTPLLENDKKILNFVYNTNFNPQYTIRAEETTIIQFLLYASRQTQNNEREDTTLIKKI
jgi:hypothetical protein